MLVKPKDGIVHSTMTFVMAASCNRAPVCDEAHRERHGEKAILSSMECTIVEYLSEQQASFADVPLNDVDSLILSTIAYFNFEKGAIGRCMPFELVPLPIAVCGISHDDLYGGIWLSRMGGDDFLKALLASPRFMSLEVGYYINDVSSHFEKQFSAVTFFLPDGSAYAAFRGTDNTLAGWKEDFNLSFMEEVPSQISARTYLEDIADTSPTHLFIGGHSKGGNLAEYAALTCREQTFGKIDRIFNHDGPGFAFMKNERIDSPEYRSKLSKTVPESSVFGMLMENRDDYRVVRATGILFAQHATTHWLIEGNDFITIDAVGPESVIVSSTLTNWAALYDSDKRALLIDAAYDILRATNADSWSELAKDPTGNALAIAEAVAQLPSDMRVTLFRMIRDIIPVLSSEASGHLREKLDI